MDKNKKDKSLSIAGKLIFTGIIIVLFSLIFNTQDYIILGIIGIILFIFLSFDILTDDEKKQRHYGYFIKAPEKDTKRRAYTSLLITLILIISVIYKTFPFKIGFFQILIFFIILWYGFWNIKNIYEYLETRRCIPIGKNNAFGDYEVKGAEAFLSFILSLLLLGIILYILIIKYPL